MQFAHAVAIPAQKTNKQQIIETTGFMASYQRLPYAGAQFKTPRTSLLFEDVLELGDERGLDFEDLSNILFEFRAVQRIDVEVCFLCFR